VVVSPTVACTKGSLETSILGSRDCTVTEPLIPMPVPHRCSDHRSFPITSPPAAHTNRIGRDWYSTPSRSSVSGPSLSGSGFAWYFGEEQGPRLAVGRIDRYCFPDCYPSGKLFASAEKLMVRASLPGTVEVVLRECISPISAKFLDSIPTRLISACNVAPR
jgi:hypothetical protein